MKIFLVLLVGVSALAQADDKAADSSKPASGETLRYNVNWPSGLSLGEAELLTSQAGGKQTLSFRVDASIPGFSLMEEVRSTATPELCSTELVKLGTRGKRKVSETTTFDQAKLIATRKTDKGGSSEVSISPCAKDVLTFIQFLRRELAAGRLPAAQKVYYGAAYQTRVVYSGTERLTIAGEATEADKLTATIKGPVADFTAELLFARDAARTPVVIRVPLALGKFSMEIVR